MAAAMQNTETAEQHRFRKWAEFALGLFVAVYKKKSEEENWFLNQLKTQLAIQLLGPYIRNKVPYYSPDDLAAISTAASNRRRSEYPDSPRVGLGAAASLSVRVPRKGADTDSVETLGQQRSHLTRALLYSAEPNIL